MFHFFISSCIYLLLCYCSWQAPGTDPALHLPTINPYIPKNLALVPENSTSDPHGHPVRLVNDPLCMLYHKTHLEFGGPKVTVRVRLSLPAAHGSLAALTATNLFVHLLDDSLAEVAYEAELAGALQHLACSEASSCARVHRPGMQHKPHSRQYWMQRQNWMQ